MRKSNVLFIIYDLERGGPELRLLDLVENLYGSFNFFICVLSNNLALYDEFIKADSSINVIPVKRPYLEFNKIYKIKKIILENKISVVNVFDIKSLMIAYVIKLVTAKRIKIIFHNVNAIQNFTGRQQVLLKCMKKGIDNIMSNSYYSDRQIRNCLGNNIVTKVIYNGVDQEIYNFQSENRLSIRNKYGIKDYEIVIGTIANFRPQKNYKFLIESFKKWLVEFPDSRLICVGGGPLLDEHKELSKKLDIYEKIIFTGYSEIAANWFSAMDIFALVSIYEGLPNVILQAMSVGVPVISTSVGGCPELINNNETGILIESNNTTQFLEGVKRCILDDDFKEKIICNAKDRIREEFDCSVMYKNYDNYFNEV